VARVVPDLGATGDATLLRNLLGNLLGNAWKFTRGREHAVIEFGAVDHPDGETEFYVRDNGAGFPQAYVDKLFRPFQRLHSQEEFSGHGIGLASVRRIIERHGGRIRAEGREGEGAVFYFTLPVAGEAIAEQRLTT
jgi:light-regulated signal transduction histidine kinase (bacteriophytochrome)